MRKLLSIITIVLLATFIMVSCSPDTNVTDNGLALITFNASDRVARSLTRTNPKLNVEDLWWSYTAVKAEGDPLTTGAKTEATAVGTKGLTETVGPFSYGKWTFTLYGYADESRTKLAYTGSSEVVIGKSTTGIGVTVSSQTADDHNGTLAVQKMGNLKLKLQNGNEISKYDNLVMNINVKGGPRDLDKNYVTLNSDDEFSQSLPSGNYTITISYCYGGTYDSSKKEYSGGYAVAEDTIYVTIANYLTTTIGGDISENTSQVEFIANGEIIKATKSETVKADEATVLAVDAAPVSAESATAPKTTVSIPSGVFEAEKSVALSVTSFSTSAIQNGDATSAGFTISSSDESTPVFGALDISLEVENVKQTDFSSNPLTITTTIAKGLNGGQDYDGTGNCSIQVKYNGEGDGGTVTKYDATTGEITFTVKHLSTYYVVDSGAKVYDSTSGKAYQTVSDAAWCATANANIVLLADVDESANGVNVLPKNLTIDLNGKTLNTGNWMVLIGEYYFSYPSKLLGSSYGYSWTDAAEKEIKETYHVTLIPDGNSFKVQGGTVTFKNGKIKSSCTNSSSYVLEVRGTASGTNKLVFDNIEFDDNSTVAKYFDIVPGADDYGVELEFNNSKLTTNASIAVFVSDNNAIVNINNDSVIENTGSGTVYSGDKLTVKVNGAIHSEKDCKKISSSETSN